MFANGYVNINSHSLLKFYGYFIRMHLTNDTRSIHRLHYGKLFLCQLKNSGVKDSLTFQNQTIILGNFR